MKIRSLEEATLGRRPVTVIANVEEFKADFSSVVSGSRFYRDIPLTVPDDLPLVLVNPNVEMVRELQRANVFQLVPETQLWVNEAGVVDFARCLSSFDEFALDGAYQDQTWLRVRLCSSSENDLSAKNLAFGLQLGMRLRNTDPTASETLMQNADAKVSFRANLIQILASTFKPIKPYLPPPLVHALYKILGAIR